MSWPCGRPCRKPSGRISTHCRSQARLCRGLGRDTALCLKLSSGHNTLQCIAIQNPSHQATSVTIQNLYRDTAFPQAKPSLLSRYTWCIATQNPVISVAQPRYKVCIVTQLPSNQASPVTIQSNCIVTFSQAKQHTLL